MTGSSETTMNAILLIRDLKKTSAALNVSVCNGLLLWPVVTLVAVFFLKLSKGPGVIELHQVKTSRGTQSTEQPPLLHKELFTCQSSVKLDLENQLL